MQTTWTYKNYEIEEGLKPGSKTFRYFFKIFEQGKKKCICCVWIAGEALSKFDQAKNFEVIVTSQVDTWHKWVKGKIDEGDFQNRALKIEKEGQLEINLSDMSDHIKPE